MLAYSDGSAIADGVEGSAAAIVYVGGTDITAIVRLAAADRPLSPGRSEWTGLLLVLYIVRRVRADVVLRLGNLQVVNTFSDGPVRYEYNWLRRNDRGMATLAWELSAEREQRGLGTLTVRAAREGCGYNCGCANPSHPRYGCCKSHPQPQRPQRQKSAGAVGVTAGVTAGVGVRVSPQHHAARSTDQPHGGAATLPRRATY